MRSRLLIILIIILLPLSAQAGETYLTFQLKNSISDTAKKDELSKLTRVVSIDNVQGRTVFAYANDRERLALERLGYAYDVLPHPGSLSDPPMSNTVENLREWDSYPTYDAYVDMMYQFAMDYPNLCQTQSIGQSIMGRELLVVKITDNVNQDEAEPEFFYTSSMHGDELTGYVLMLRLIDYLLSTYGSDTEVTNLVDNIEIWINPLSNPDGTYRKDDSTVNGAWRYNSNEVDLNRNFPDPQDGPHPDGNDWQPENIAMMDFAEARNFSMSANFHGGVEVVNYPWDTWPDLHADNNWYQDISHTYADAAQRNSPDDYMDGFDDGTTNGYDWYEVNGGRQDYMNYFHHCREVTIEISNVKLIPPDQLPAHWDYNRESFLLYMAEVLYGIRGVVTNSAGDPLPAKVTVLNHDVDNSEVVADPVTGNYHRMIEPGTYDLVFSLDGYVPQTVTGVTAVDGDVTILDVVLEESAPVTISGTVTDAETNAPIVNATVFLANTDIPLVYTDDAGVYTIPDVPANIYTIRAFKVGYAEARQTETVTPDNTEFDFMLTPTDAESFETGTYPDGWTFGGDADWFVTDDTAFDGLYSARSGDISHNQTSVLSITVFVQEADTLSFYRKTSCEDAGGNNYDYLKFEIDDVERGRWDGDTPWGRVAYAVEAGEHTFSWIYRKDGNVSSGEDCAWIDFVDFPTSNLSQPTLTVGTAALDFGEVPVGENSVLTYTVSGNDLSENVVVTAPGGFWVSRNGTNFYTLLNLVPEGGLLPPTTIHAKFSPTTLSDYSGNISHTNPSVPTAYVAVTGTGVAPPSMTVMPSELNFDTVTVGENSVQNYTLSASNLSGDVTITAPDDYAVSVDSSTFSDVLTLSPTNGTVPETTVQVRFAPTADSLYADQIEHESPGATTQAVAVSGQGVFPPTLAADPAELAFGEVIVGQSETLVYLLSGDNLTDDVTITAPAGFQVADDGASFAPQLILTPDNGAVDAVITAQFSPDAAQTYTGQISHQSAGTASIFVVVSGTGVAANQPPEVMQDIPNQTAVVGSFFEFQFAATTFFDPDNDPLTYTAMLLDDTLLPAWLNFDASTRTFSGTPSEPGSMQIAVTASDGNGGAITAIFQLDVDPIGDFSGDGVLNDDDVVLLLDVILDMTNEVPSQPDHADINGDGSVDILDIMLLLDEILP